MVEWLFVNRSPPGGPLMWVGSDGIEDDRRMYQCFVYMRDPFNPSDVDSNHYAFPLAISPVVDAVDMRVTRIDVMATGTSFGARKTPPMKIQPPSEYLPEYQDLRTDLKPLNVIQPEGASFNVIQSGETGHVIEWQKWTLRVGFNQREGVVIYNVGAFSQLVASITHLGRFDTTAEISSIGFLWPI